MSECKFKVGDWVKCIKFDGATGKRLALWKGPAGIYQILKTERKHGTDYIYLDGDYSQYRGVFASRFVLVDAPPMESDSLEDILAEQELYAKLEAER